MSKKQVEQQAREDYVEEDKADLEAQAKLQQQYIAEALAESKPESTFPVHQRRRDRRGARRLDQGTRLCQPCLMRCATPRSGGTWARARPTP
jgi:hypothetical protein